ncbi:cyclic nucleotide-binding domain-containing protein 2-like [Haliotis asinina]|uniref:cyclic nucleotide-binding domain-containing protein 2-like n=1 Tax=Haliotis asinina TaxID=109174 RepID=UPI0035327187
MTERLLHVTLADKEHEDRHRQVSRQVLHSAVGLTMSKQQLSIPQALPIRRGSSSQSLSGSSVISASDWRGAGSTRRGSRGSLKRNSLPLGSVGTRQWMRRPHPQDRLTEAEEAERAKKLLGKFRMWARVVQAFCNLFRRCSALESSDSPYYSQLDTIEKTSLGIDKNHYIFFDPADYKANTQMRMSRDGQRILSKPPDDRTEEEIHHVMIALRGIRAIEDLPIRMQKHLARYSTFQSFGSKRMIVKQHRQPEFFYFLLLGTVMVAVLQESGYAKTAVELTRGHSFGELAIMSGTTRQSSIITKTPVELLAVTEENYRRIFMVGGIRSLHDPDHLEFLGNLAFLQDWPLELLTGADAKLVTFCYFRCKTVMVKDSNASDWIFVVKSGSVTVLKKLVKAQPTLNKKTGRYHQVAHTSGYLAFQSNVIAYSRYLAYNNRTLPSPLSLSLNSSFTTDSDVTQSSDVTDDVDGFLRRATRVNRPMTCSPQRKLEVASGPRMSKSAVCRVQKRKTRSAETISNASTPTSTTITDDSGVAGPNDDGNAHVDSQRGRIRTFLDDLDGGVSSKPLAVTEADENPEFVLVQTLTKGQVFGLEQVVLGDQPSLSLVSNGVECLMINKRFYLDHCPPALLRRLKTQVSPYPSDERLQGDLVVRADWEVYKQCVTAEVLVNRPYSTHHPQEHLSSII